MTAKLRKQVEDIRQRYGGMTVRAEGPLNDIVTLLRAIEELDEEVARLDRQIAHPDERHGPGPG